MCLVSDKIKFCTCTSKNYETLKHYWLLYRHDLVVTINCQSDEVENPFTYAFDYKNGEWITSTDDPFDLINNYNEEAFGKLKLPISKKNT